MKIALITDTHIGPHSDSLDNSRSSQFLKCFLNSELLKIAPDMVVHLGDHIQHLNRETDLLELGRLVARFKSLRYPALNIIGNHDQYCLSYDDILGIMGKSTPWYSIDLNGWHFVVLYSMTQEPGACVPSEISQQQRSWLEIDLGKTELPTVVLTHYSLADVDLSRNRHFADRPDCALIVNRKEVRAILERSGKVRAVLNGHLHMNNLTVHEGIPYFTLQAVAEKYNLQRPGVAVQAWGVLNISDSEISLEVFGSEPETLTFFEVSSTAG